MNSEAGARGFSHWGGRLKARLKWLLFPGRSSEQLLSRVHIKLDRLSRRVDSMADRLEKSVLSAPPIDKGTQILLSNSYRELARKGIFLPFPEVEFRNFSQTGEDGILHYIFSLVGTTDRRSVEMCAGTGIQCNSTNLIIHHGWTSLLVDGDEDNVRKGRKFFLAHGDTQLRVPKFVRRWIHRDSVNSILSESGFSGEIDLFCLDLDGVDYWIWEALTVISPRVVVVEVNTSMGAASVSVPYNRKFKARWIPLTDTGSELSGKGVSGPGNFFERYTVYAGASLPAFIKLARSKGYRLVGVNSIGFNAFFLRDDVGVGEFPEVTAESCLVRQDSELNAVATEKLGQFPWVEI